MISSSSLIESSEVAPDLRLARRSAFECVSPAPFVNVEMTTPVFRLVAVTCDLGTAAPDARGIACRIGLSRAGGYRPATRVRAAQRQTAASPGQAVDQNLLRERIAEVLRSLPPRDREVIELRYGLRDGRSRSLDEVAQVFGVTRERIRQIEIRGLVKLRQPERRKRLADFAGAA